MELKMMETMEENPEIEKLKNMLEKFREKDREFKTK